MKNRDKKQPPSKQLMQMTTEIVAAFVSNNSIRANRSNYILFDKFSRVRDEIEGKSYGISAFDIYILNRSYFYSYKPYAISLLKSIYIFKYCLNLKVCSKRFC